MGKRVATPADAIPRGPWPVSAEALDALSRSTQSRSAYAKCNVEVALSSRLTTRRDAAKRKSRSKTSLRRPSKTCSTLQPHRFSTPKHVYIPTAYFCSTGKRRTSQPHSFSRRAESNVPRSKNMCGQKPCGLGFLLPAKPCRSEIHTLTLFLRSTFLDYQELVHVLIRRTHPSSQALLEAWKAPYRDRSSTRLSHNEIARTLVSDVRAMSGLAEGTYLPAAALFGRTKKGGHRPLYDP